MNRLYLPISASDPDGQSLTYSATGLPAGLSIYSSGLISGTLASTAAGTYYVTVSVSDGALNASASFTWIVYNVNNPPIITNPGNQTNNENESVNLPISASDPDGQSLTYSATGLPPYLSISSSGLISGTLASTAAGTYYVTVSVSDGALNASASFTWIVYNVFPGCTDPTAFNYDASATIDDGSCITSCVIPTNLQLQTTYHDRAWIQWDEMSSIVDSVVFYKIRYREVGDTSWLLKQKTYEGNQTGITRARLLSLNRKYSV